MAVSAATCQLEPYGLRLTYRCGTEQYYAGVDVHTYICNAFHAHYQIVTTAPSSYAVEEVDV